MNDLTQLDRSKLAWRRDPASKDGSSVHRRLLGPTEHGFYWDVLFNGVAIAINSAEVEVVGGREEEMFAKENFETAWVRLKQRHLLLAASMDDSRSQGHVEFVLDEHALYNLRPGEVSFLDCQTDEDADKLTDELQNGIHKPDPDVLAKVWAVTIASKPRTRRIYITIQHHITDGVGNASIMRGYCQELSTSSKELVVDGLGPLAERLYKTQPLELFTPSSHLNLPRRRWRLAIAKVISELPRNKPQGGHTLPKLASSGDDTIVPALSRTVYAPALPASISSQILKSCRALGITFGNALPVLSQLGHARVLHRLYHEGKISEQEWQQRRIQPMIFTGPINIRPYLDREWFQNGGEHEVLMAISFWNTVLPFMPTSSVVAEGGVPPFDTLLSHKRFLHRALLARKQQTKRLKYPLLLDFHELRMPGRIRATRVLTQRWEAQQEGREYTGNEAQYGGSFKTMGSCVFANGGSSLGNRDKVIPLEYPLPTQDSPPPAPRLRIVHYRSALRCRPTELYLGAVTSHEQLRFYAHVDANTFDETLVREWVEEVGKAAVHYLGSE